jgi:hypothetical protein
VAQVLMRRPPHDTDLLCVVSRRTQFDGLLVTAAHMHTHTYTSGRGAVCVSHRAALRVALEKVTEEVRVVRPKEVKELVDGARHLKRQ